jgi:hypothetical protein
VSTQPKCDAAEYSFVGGKAIVAGHVKVIQRLYELMPTMLDWRTDSGETLLHVAAANNKKAVIRWLAKTKPVLLETATESVCERDLGTQPSVLMCLTGKHPASPYPRGERRTGC